PTQSSRVDGGSGLIFRLLDREPSGDQPPCATNHGNELGWDAHDFRHIGRASGADLPDHTLVDRRPGHPGGDADQLIGQRRNLAPVVWGIGNGERDWLYYSVWPRGVIFA